jgi:hypothetical protein
VHFSEYSKFWFPVLTPKSINLGYQIYTVVQYHSPMMDFGVSTENQNFKISKNRFFTKIQKVTHKILLTNF